MANVYINGMEIIAITDWADDTVGWKMVDLPKIDPNNLSAGASRRMSKAVKMGVWASYQAIEQAQVEQIDAIIVGTGKGCLIDSDKFLHNLISNQESYLTPTAFIQSTHNTVAGQIALVLKNHAYNMTFSQGRSSFESAILDAFIQITFDESTTILVGGVDEISENSAKIIDKYLVGQLEQSQFKTAEGAGFFILSGERNEKSVASILDITIFHHLNDKHIDKEILNFITHNKLTFSDIDLVIIASDTSENSIAYTSTLFANTATLAYQLHSGKYDTDSNFALYLGAYILCNQTIPENYSPRLEKNNGYQFILIVNVHEQTSFLLLSTC